MVDDVKTVKDKMLEEGATNAQTGHVYMYVQNKPQSDNQGNNLYVQFSLEICNLYCNKQTNIHVRLHQHDQLLRDAYFKYYYSIFSLLSKSDQVEKVEGLQLRTLQHVVLFL